MWHGIRTGYISFVPTTWRHHQLACQYNHAAWRKNQLICISKNSLVFFINMLWFLAVCMTRNLMSGLFSSGKDFFIDGLVRKYHKHCYIIKIKKSSSVCFCCFVCRYFVMVPRLLWLLYLWILTVTVRPFGLRVWPS